MRAHRLLLVLLCAGAAVAPLMAQESDSLVDKWEIRVGVFFPSYDTDVRVDANEFDLGTKIDLESDIGIDDSEEIFRLDVAYRIKRRHQIGFGYWDSSRDGSRTASFELRFGDVTIPFDAVVDGAVDAEFADFRYTYWMVLKEKTAVAVRVGLVTWEIDVELGLGERRFEGRLSSEASIDEIIPEIGFELRQALSPKWLFHAGFNGIFFETGDTEGEVFEMAIGFQHKTWKNAGIGVAFDAVDADVDDFEERVTGTYELTMTGVRVYVPIRF